MNKGIGFRVQGIVVFVAGLSAFFLCTLYALPSTLPIYAATASSSASASDSDLQAKLDQLKQEIASKAAKLKDSISNQIQNKVYAGFIQDLSDSQYSLTNLDGSSRVVSINEFTKDDFQGKKITKKISKGDFIIALGDVDDQNRLVAKDVIKTASPSATPTTYLWGKILSKGANSIKIQTKNSDQLTLTYNSDTTFKLKSDDATSADAKVGNFLIGVGTLEKDGSLDTRFIYLIPSPGNLKPDKEATSSATPSAKKK